MPQILLVACCFLACPLLMGAMMLWLGRDSEGRRLDRELRRLNAAADVRRAERDSSVLRQGNAATMAPDRERLQAALNEPDWPTVVDGQARATAEVTADHVA